MSSATFSIEPAAPFRLDLTAWVLRRRPDNIIDRWDGSTYRRVLVIEGQPVGTAISQTGPPERPIIQVTVSGDILPPDTETLVASVLTRMLGIGADLGDFYRLTTRDPQLDVLARRFRGVKPPRFPTLFEALVNAIACQQLSLLVGILLLDRLAESYGPSLTRRNEVAYAFPGPESLAGPDPKSLQTLGFSHNKALLLLNWLRPSLESGLISMNCESRQLRRSGSFANLYGVGRWTAEYVLLRGAWPAPCFPGG